MNCHRKFVAKKVEVGSILCSYHLLARSTGRPDIYCKFLCFVCCYIFNSVIFYVGSDAVYW
jgi:hypothetical protein